VNESQGIVDNAADRTRAAIDRAPRIYVAASSKEVARAQAAMRLVRELGGEVVGDWTPAVLTYGSSGEALSDAENERLSAEQLVHVARSDALVLLVPEVVATVGAWVELGVAWGRELPCVASSVAPRLPWPARWVERVGTDDVAVVRALDLARAGVRARVSRAGRW
jgi:hypothetical protein